MLGFVAEAARHAAAAGLHRLHVKSGHEAQNLLHRRHRIERLLVTVPMQKRPLFRLAEAELARVLREELLKEVRALRERVTDQNRELVA